MKPDEIHEPCLLCGAPTIRTVTQVGEALHTTRRYVGDAGLRALQEERDGLRRMLDDTRPGYEQLEDERARRERAEQQLRDVIRAANALEKIGNEERAELARAEQAVATLRAAAHEYITMCTFDTRDALIAVLAAGKP